MFRLIIMELKRLKYSKAFYVTLIGYIIAIGLGVQDLGDVEEGVVVNLQYVISTFASGYILFVLFLSIFVSAYIQLDFKCGQIKNIVTATKDRGRFVSIKFATLCVLSLVASLISVILIYVIGAYGKGYSIDTSDALKALLLFVEMYLGFLFLHAVYMFLSIVLKKEMVCILLGIGIGIGMPLAYQLIMLKTGVDLSKASVLGNLMGLSGGQELKDMLLYIALGIVYTAVAVILSKVVIRKRDIHI